jgi:alkylglycerol monooxygenase
MEAYGKILLIAMPSFLVLILFEKWWGWRKGNDTFRANDTISSLSSGITNAVKDVLGLSVAIISYPWLVSKLAVANVDAGWLTYFVAFIALDFAGYWVHRLNHEVNLFWNNHIIHHSSEEFNLACALRQSISNIVRVFAIFLLPAALLGVPQSVIAIVAPLHLFAQFWYHTQHIGTMGFLEKIIVTPSHHRVHHAINKEYIDKNYGQIFIFWDKLFGSFQQELPGVKPVYGVTRPVRTWNPIKINFMHLWQLILDAWHTTNTWDKFRIWLMPLGWRPSDVAQKFPLFKIENVLQYEKYNLGNSSNIMRWTMMQMTVTLIFISYLFGNIASIGAPDMFVYGAFTFLSVYAYTELLDQNPNAFIWEGIKNGMGIFLLISDGDWFGASSFFPQVIYLLYFYFVGSFFVCFWFCNEIKRKEKEMVG